MLKTSTRWRQHTILIKAVKMSETATLVYDGKTFELPVVTGTE